MTTKFPKDTVKYRIQIIVNQYHDHHLSPVTKQKIQEELNRVIPTVCADKLVVADDEALEARGAIRVDCEVRGEKRSYEVFAEEQAATPLLPPFSLEESNAAFAQFEANRGKPAKVVLIAARTPSGVIGMEGDLPWMIKEDLQHFKKTTMNRPLIVGATTYLSMPAVVWQTRIPHVLTHRCDELRALMPPPGEYHFSEDLASLINAARLNYGEEDVYLAGGAATYEAALKLGLVDEMLISEINQHYIGDVYFPNDETKAFRFATVVSKHAEFSVVRYTKRPPEVAN